MRYPDRATVCISSQAGCGMACPFCATGQGGLERNLSTAEIVGPGAPAAAAARDGALRRARRGCPTSCSWAWASRWPTTSAWSRRCGGSPTPRPDGLGHLRARRHGLDRRAGPGDRQAGRRGPAGHPRRLPARPGRRAARHAGAGQHPLEGRRGPRRRPPLRDHDRPPRVDRVRADPRRQRPAVAGGPARQAPAAADRAKLVHVNLIPLNPTPGAEWDASPRPVQDEFVAPAAGRRASRAPSATPAGGRSPAPAASSPPTGAPSDDRHTRRPDRRQAPFERSSAQTPRGPEGQTVRCAATRDAAGHADAGQAGRRRSRPASSTSPSGTASARSSSATATRSRSAAATSGR